jgi:hypothetical protein
MNCIDGELSRARRKELLIQLTYKVLTLIGSISAAEEREALKILQETVERNTGWRPWKKMRSNDFGREEIMKRLLSEVEVQQEAKTLLAVETEKWRHQDEEICLIKITAEELGVKVDEAGFIAIKDCDLERWSQENLAGRRLAWCPTEVGLWLALNYREQGRGERVWLAMKGTMGSDGSPRTCVIGKRMDGGRYLAADRAEPSPEWVKGKSFIFCVRNLV